MGGTESSGGGAYWLVVGWFDGGRLDLVKKKVQFNTFNRLRVVSLLCCLVTQMQEKSLCQFSVSGNLQIFNAKQSSGKDTIDQKIFIAR